MQAAEQSGDSGHRLSKMWNWMHLMMFFFICKLSTTEAEVGLDFESCKTALNVSQALAEDAEQKLLFMMAIAAIFCILWVATLLYLYKKPTTSAAGVGGDDPTVKLEALTQELVSLQKKYEVLKITTELYKSATSTLDFSMPACMVTTILYYISEDLGKKFYGLKYTIKWLFPIDWIVQFLACGIIVFVIMVPIYTCMGIYQAQSLSWDMLQTAITSSFELIMWLPMTVWGWFMSHASATANGWWYGGSSK
jgi:hypothetical protein